MRTSVVVQERSKGIVVDNFAFMQVEHGRASVLQIVSICSKNRIRAGICEVPAREFARAWLVAGSKSDLPVWRILQKRRDEPASKRPRGSSIDIVAASNAYRATFPGRDIHDMRLLGEGWDSVVFLVDDALVLRFPETSSAARAMAKEIRLLPYLRDRLPLSIPQPIVVGVHPFERSWPFMGYVCVTGVELTRERFLALPSHARIATMQSLAAFLEALHTVDVDATRECDVPVRDLRAEFVDVFARSQALVAPVLDRRERAAFVALYQAILNDAQTFRATPTLIHGDMSPEHIFYDGTTHRISGIIDFGDVAIADPDYDLMYLLEDYGQPFLRALLRYYRHADPERLLGKLQAFRLFDAARYTLFGHTRGDDEMICDGLDGLRELLDDRDASRST